MHNVLRQIARELQLGKQIVGRPELAGEVQLFEAALLGQDSLDFGCERLIPCLLVVEELGALGRIVNDLGDLAGIRTAG